MPIDEEQRFAAIKEQLYVAAVCDMLDSLGYRHQAMHQRLRPLLPDRRNCGFVGRARTIRWTDMDYIVEEDPYGPEIEVMHSLRPGEVELTRSERIPKLGERVHIIPNHVCPTVKLHNQIYLRHDDGQIEQILVDARGKLS